MCGLSQGRAPEPSLRARRAEASAIVNEAAAESSRLVADAAVAAAIDVADTQPQHTPTFSQHVSGAGCGGSRDGPAPPRTPPDKPSP